MGDECRRGSRTWHPQTARGRLTDGRPTAGEVEDELDSLGLVGMFDPPRPEVPAAAARCGRAGIRIVMVTGDSGLTAEAIARRIGCSSSSGLR